ncbi:MAG: hypothetical protein WHV67_08265 [Thermoanaerobaculia bacterium]
MKDTKLWTLHLFAGIVILFLLGLHMGIMHLDEILKIFNPAGGEGIDWQNVLARMKMLGFAIVYILLLGFALYHGFYGLNKIIGEANVKDKTRKFVSLVLTIFGFLLFVFGTYSAIAAKVVSVKW